MWEHPNRSARRAWNKFQKAKLAAALAARMIEIEDTEDTKLVWRLEQYAQKSIQMELCVRFAYLQYI